MKRGTMKTRWIALLALLPAIAVGANTAPAGARPMAAQAYTFERLLTVAGEPDDIAVDALGHLVWGNLRTGSIQRFDGRSIETVASGLSEPEGIVILSDGSLVVAEQGRDRLVRLGPGKRRSVVLRLQPVSGQDGVDGIALDPRSRDLLVPDSPRGVLLRVSVDGRHAAVLARGLGRPVGAAVDAGGRVWVADEHLNAVLSLAPSRTMVKSAALSVPDDVVVDRRGWVWVTTLGDGGLWVIKPGQAALRVLSALADPQGLALDRCDNPIVVQSARGVIDRLVIAPNGGHCLAGE
jgi:sugar lactone lactonase YvrE